MISSSLIKCKAPPFAPLVAQQRHEVAITLVACSTNAAVLGAIPFTYVAGQLALASSPTVLAGASLASQSSELLLRVLNSLERAQVATVASGASSGDGSGMERIMSFYRDRFNEDAGRSGRYSEPVFTAQEIKMLQACLLKRTGRLSLVDGRWGRETTGALLGVTVQESDWVIDCVLES